MVIGQEDSLNSPAAEGSRTVQAEYRVTLYYETN